MTHSTTDSPPAPEAILFSGASLVTSIGQTILHDINLAIQPSERVALLGRSGAGKTTLLRSVNGLTHLTAGTVSVDGKSSAAWNLLALRRHCGYVLQDGGLFPHMSCEENVRLPLRVQGLALQFQAARVAELFRLVGLEREKFGQRRPRELSGGQRQRVGVARALATNPPILLMDEPFGALDPLTRREMQTMVLDIFAATQKTALMVTHDLEEALTLATRIVLMEAGEIAVDLPVAEFVEAQHPLAVQYLGAARGTVARKQAAP